MDRRLRGIQSDLDEETKKLGETTKKLYDSIDEEVDSLEKDSELRKKLDYGPMLAGQVSEEIGVPMEVAKKSIGPELATAITNYIYQSTGNKITKCNFIKIWIVRQFGTEYNPVHFHSGHLSGAGWLKVPSTFGKSIFLSTIVLSCSSLELGENISSAG